MNDYFVPFLVLQIIPQDVASSRHSDRLRAIELSVPNVIATFVVVHRDSNFDVIDSRTYNIDLNSGLNLIGVGLFKMC